MLTWTVGAGGLIGSAVQRLAEEPFAGNAIPWSDPDAAQAVLRDDLARFCAQAGDQPWAIVWAAGAATTSTSDAAAMAEAAFFRAFAEQVALRHPSGPGAFLVCSSAGGIHAGSSRPPFDENTEPAPLGAYGRARLAQEIAAGEVLGEQMPVVIARISNVYGPGQKLDKLQGLVSRLALCSITRDPLNLFVPLSTVRDYIYVDDAARAIHAWLDYALRNGGSGVQVRLIASGEGTSVGMLVRTAQTVAHRKVPIAMGAHPSSSLQAADLRFVPSSIPGRVPEPVTPLPVGIKRVFDDVRWRLQHASVG